MSASEPQARVIWTAHDEFERWRRLIPTRPDWHLHNWGCSCRAEKIVEGYATHSTCLENMGGNASEEGSALAYERGANYLAEVADSIISYSLPLQYRTAISHVYAASVWKARTVNLLEEYLIEGAGMFWRIALQRGLT